MTAPVLLPAVLDVQTQVARLVAPGFASSAGATRLGDVERYLAAVDRRLDKLPGAVGRDADAMARIRYVEDEYHRLVDGLPPGASPAAVEHIRWMIEELRVSLFAQTLGTAHPVSEKRILQAIAAAA
jgi:ATP-dependent helicase HrpA